jgi:prepilin-type N-terminal cleavage/methylation domain-containing protein
MRNKGFALLELIVTLLLVAVMAAMVVPYFLSGVTHGADPLAQMPTPLGLQKIMANIVADYENSGPNSYLHNLGNLSSNITTGRYGITASHTITKDPNYKFDPADLDTALKVSIKDNATGQSVTYIFTRQQ